MDYSMYYGQPSVFATIAQALFIAVLAYGAFPTIFALCSPKISAKRYRWICFLANFVVYLCFALIGGNYNAAPYLLWTVIFCAIFKRFLPKIDPPIDYSKMEKKSFEEISSSVPEEVLAQCGSQRGNREGITRVAEAFAKDGVIPLEYVPVLVEEFMKPAEQKQIAEDHSEEPQEELPAEQEPGICYCRFCGVKIAEEDKFCRSCGAELNSAIVHESKPEKTVTEKSVDYRAFIAIGAIVLLVLVAVIVVIGMVGNSSEPVSTPEPTEAPTPIPTYQAGFPPAAAPYNGQILITPSYECLCPFEVSVQGDNAYYVYLEYMSPSVYSSDSRGVPSVSAASAVDDIAFYIAPNSAVEINVPVGVYKLYYACGKSWYGLDQLFGEETLYSTSDELLEFYTDYSTAYGHSLELWSQYDGNFETENIDATQFPG